jgi:hypothetical protein
MIFERVLQKLISLIIRRNEKLLKHEMKNEFMKEKKKITIMKV